MKDKCFMAKNFGEAVCVDCTEPCSYKKEGPMAKKEEEPKKKPEKGKIVDKLMDSIMKLATGDPDKVLKLLASKEKQGNLSPIITLVVHTLMMGKAMPLGKALLAGMMISNALDEAGLIDTVQLKKLMDELLEYREKKGPAKGKNPFFGIPFNQPYDKGDGFDFESLRNKFEGKQPKGTLNDFFGDFKKEFGKD